MALSLIHSIQKTNDSLEDVNGSTTVSRNEVSLLNQNKFKRENAMYIYSIHTSMCFLGLLQIE